MNVGDYVRHKKERVIMRVARFEMKNITGAVKERIAYCSPIGLDQEIPLFLWEIEVASSVEALAEVRRLMEE